MHIPDLTPCRYHSGPFDAANWSVPLLAVGWLEHPAVFSTNEVPLPLLSRLRTLIAQSKSQYRQYGFRGTHECSLCAATSRVSPTEAGWSQENLFVPGAGAVYVVPGGIVHYIEEHAYVPPAAFLNALAVCPDVDSDDYPRALRRSNADTEPPLNETWDECLAKSRAFAESLRARRAGPASGS